jgi:hypothetical protein
LDEKCKVSVINFLLNKNFVGGKKITPSIGTHAWRAFFEVLFKITIWKQRETKKIR